MRLLTRIKEIFNRARKPGFKWDQIWKDAIRNDIGDESGFVWTDLHYENLYRFIFPEDSDYATFMVDKDAYKSWKDVLGEISVQQNVRYGEPIKDVLIEFGNDDFSDWGPLKFPANSENILLSGYLSEGTHVFHQEKKTILDSIALNWCRNIGVFNISFSSGTDEKIYGDGTIVNGIHTSKIVDCSRIFIKECEYTNMTSGAAVRVHNCSDIFISDNVFYDKFFVPGDIGGVAVHADVDNACWNVRIENNSFRNLTDAIGWTTYGDESQHATGSLMKCTFNANHVWVTPEYYRITEARESINDSRLTSEQACAEDGVDIKSGAFTDITSDYYNEVAYNVLHGFRPTNQACGGSGSAGSGIVLHRMASRINIHDNIIFDTTGGIRLYGKSKEDEDLQFINVENNLINQAYQFGNRADRDTSPYGVGIAIGYVDNTIRVAYNTIVEAYRAFTIHDKSEAKLEDNVTSMVVYQTGYHLKTEGIVDAELKRLKSTDIRLNRHVDPFGTSTYRRVLFT